MHGTCHHCCFKSSQFICGTGLIHRQFKKSLKDVNFEFEDVAFYTHARWLYYGKVLKKVFYLHEEIYVSFDLIVLRFQN